MDIAARAASLRARLLPPPRTARVAPARAAALLVPRARRRARVRCLRGSAARAHWGSAR